MDENSEVIAVKRENLTVVSAKRIVEEEEEEKKKEAATKGVGGEVKKTDDELYNEWKQQQTKMATARAEELRTQEDFERRNADRQGQSDTMAKKRKREHDSNQLGQVYASGFPLEEFSERFIKTVFSKAGKVLFVKMYRDENGHPKGDALITYSHKDMAEQACLVLNGKEVRTGYCIQVSAAEY